MKPCLSDPLSIFAPPAAAAAAAAALPVSRVMK